MIAPETVRAGAENLVETYLRLGQAIPGTVLWETDAFIGCEGTFPYAAANFVVARKLDPWAARRLQEHAARCRSFYAYVLPGEQAVHHRELLSRAGFERAYRLAMMVAERPLPGDFPLRTAETLADRLVVAEFMVNQFFTDQSPSFRQCLAAATARAEGPSLHYIAEREQILGAVMLSPGGSDWGVYNLCVAPSRRNRGIGGNILLGALALAQARGSLVTLQCSPSLEDWYKCRGFAAIGWVDAYYSPKTNRDTIIL